MLAAIGLLLLGNGSVNKPSQRRRSSVFSVVRAKGLCYKETKKIVLRVSCFRELGRVLEMAVAGD
jgi:hypothetical protein